MVLNNHWSKAKTKMQGSGSTAPLAHKNDL